MKMILWIGIAAGLMMLGGGCQTAPSRGGEAIDRGTDRIVGNEVVIVVHGLSCPLCSNNLDGQLKRIPGVESATIDLKSGAVTVRMAENHAVTREDLARAVERAGFTLKAIQPGGGK
mgnify:CR=1 FL=1